MTLADPIARSGGTRGFCGTSNDLKAVGVPGSGDILLCPICREENSAPTAHWRCLAGAAWSAEPAAQLAVWRKQGTLDAAWATQARAGMMEPAGEDAGPAPSGITIATASGWRRAIRWC